MRRHAVAVAKRCASALGVALAVGMTGGAEAQEPVTPVTRLSTGMVGVGGGQIVRLTVNEAGFQPTPAMLIKLTLVDEHGVRLAERESTVNGGETLSLVYTRPATSARVLLRGLVETRGPFTPLLANARLVATLEISSGSSTPPWTELAVSCPFRPLPSGAAPGTSGPFEPYCPPPCALDFSYE